MLKIALCDDNHTMLDHYAGLLTRCAKKHQIEIEIACFYSGEALLFHLEEEPQQKDIIYLDILMDKTNGMETARKLRDSGCLAQIVFLTSCADYVYEAFDVHAVQYLLKDEITQEKFEEVFLRVAELASQKEEELFVCEFRGTKTAVPVRSISHFEIWKRVVTVYFDTNQTAKFYASMEQLENRFASQGFIRAHRSYLVHLSHIAQIQSQSLLLKNGAAIPMGGTYMQPLKKAFSDYISRGHIRHPSV